MKLLIFAFLILTSLKASQAVVPIELLYSDKYHSCTKEIISEADAAKCLEKEIVRADKKLNTAYRKAQKRMQIFRHDDLQKIQRIWIKYRDAKCNFFYHKESGTAGLSNAEECRLNETILRTIELDETY